MCVLYRAGGDGYFEKDAASASFVYTENAGSPWKGAHGAIASGVSCALLEARFCVIRYACGVAGVCLAVRV